MNRRTFITTLALAPQVLPLHAGAGALDADFCNPPDLARPWVYWFWINGNISKEGITADLESFT